MTDVSVSMQKTRSVDLEKMARERVAAWKVCFSMHALDVTRLDCRLGQSWSPLQAADGGASMEAWVIKDTFMTGVLDCQ
jgi:hypothetical protein